MPADDPDADRVYEMTGQTGSLCYMAPEVLLGCFYNQKAREIHVKGPGSYKPVLTIPDRSDVPGQKDIKADWDQASQASPDHTLTAAVPCWPASKTKAEITAGGCFHLSSFPPCKLRAQVALRVNPDDELNSIRQSSDQLSTGDGAQPMHLTAAVLTTTGRRLQLRRGAVGDPEVQAHHRRHPLSRCRGVCRGVCTLSTNGCFRPNICGFGFGSGFRFRDRVREDQRTSCRT